jgi:xanthine dehydrogenase small subunit
MLRFILNDQLIETPFAAGMTMLDFIRYHKRLTGTKIGCREGDCGACTILAGDFENEKLIYRSITSCLMPLGNANGKHIVTVEGINMASLSPVQQAMVDANGTQCGFCTIGFVMSLTGFELHPDSKKYENAIASIDGNICRCTGYKSIERASLMLTERLNDKPEEGTTEWLVNNKFIPAYFSEIHSRLKNLKESIALYHVEPDGHADKMMLGGGTDLMVQKLHTVKKSFVSLLSDEKKLNGISEVDGFCHIGASVTVSEFAESPLIQSIFPDLMDYIKLISSTPIRNMATIGGNLVNASPIGDMSIFLLALDAELILILNNHERRIMLKDFYKAYKQTDLTKGEIISKIIFKIPSKDSFFNFEKVCKRRWLDIASVNSACHLMIENEAIHNIHLSAGGVAPYPKYLSATCSFLTGKKITYENILQAVKIMYDEIAPISDARGSADYKKLLLRQLFVAHLIKFCGLTSEIKKVLK